MFLSSATVQLVRDHMINLQASTGGRGSELDSFLLVYLLFVDFLIHLGAFVCFEVMKYI